MGYALMMAPCVLCGRVFGFNPHKVPSIRVNDKREPLCEPCVIKSNAKRKELGLDPWPDIQPGAYDPIEEIEL